MNRKLLGSLALLVALGIATCCTSGGDPLKLEDMTAERYESFCATTAATFAAVAQTAIAEGDLTVESTRQVAAALRGIATQPDATAASALLRNLDLDGYGALALQVALIQLNGTLANTGVLDGLITPRGQDLLIGVADALDAVTAD